MTATKPLNRAQLADELERVRASHRECDQQRRGAVAHAEQLRGSLDDVKARLALAEGETERMAGYIARVQEDDIVRDPLVQVGDPEGEQQLVPKRKPTPFYPPKRLGDDRPMTATEVMHHYRDAAGTPKPRRHWVTY